LNASKTLALTAPYTTVTAGVFYIGVCVVATQPPRIPGAAAASTVNYRLATPYVVGTHGTTLSTPASCPATLSGIGAPGIVMYGEVL
jgi:hypothetical protein